MPKKKAVPQEEPEQTAAEPLEQDGTELHAPPEELPMDGAAPDGPPPPEMGKFYEAPPTPTDASGLPVKSEVTPQRWWRWTHLIPWCHQRMSRLWRRLWKRRNPHPS